ncbi:hypothetical protein HDU67_001534 [Dinochytrium kinnereticum]|nr:hypothetical protein HDU67_001534 [Dinochytrium kinnereticum]
MASDSGEEIEAQRALASLTSSLPPSNSLHIISLLNGALLATSNPPPAELPKTLFGLVSDSKRVVTATSEKLRRITVAFNKRELILTVDNKFIYAVDREI